MAQSEANKVVPICDAAEAPLARDWWNLAAICRNVDCIVDDEPTVPEGARVGLLARIGRVVRGDGQDEPLRSVLGARMAEKGVSLGWWPFTQPASAGLPFPDSDDGLCAILPGVHNLGHSRAERIKALRVLLANLPAYKWLTGHASGAYRGALSKMGSRVLRRLVPSFASDVAEFRLVAALCDPLATYLLYSKNPELAKYPKVDDVANALKAAREARSLFLKFPAVYQLSGVTLEAREGIDAFVRDMEELEAKYKKKPGDGEVDAKSKAVQGFARGMREQLGGTTPAVLCILAKLVDYSIPEDRAVRLVQQMDGTKPTPRPKVDRSPKLPAEPVGVWSGLGARLGIGGHK